MRDASITARRARVAAAKQHPIAAKPIMQSAIAALCVLYLEAEGLVEPEGPDARADALGALKDALEVIRGT